MVWYYYYYYYYYVMLWTVRVKLILTASFCGVVLLFLKAQSSVCRVTSNFSCKRNVVQ